MNFHIIPRNPLPSTFWNPEGGSLLLFLVLSHAGIVFGEPYLRQLSGRCWLIWLLIVGGGWGSTSWSYDYIYIYMYICNFLASFWVNQSENFHGVRVKSLLKI